MQPNLADDFFRTAIMLFQAGRKREAEQACVQALNADPRHPYGLYLLGVIAGEAGRLADAVALFDRALAVAPDFAEAHGNRGIALISLGRVREAEAAITRALMLDPQQAVAWFNLGGLKAGQKEHYAAYEAFLHVLEIEPRNGAAWANMAIAMYEMGNLDDALAAYERALSVLPGKAFVHYHLANTLQALGRPDEAVAASRRAVELDPNHVAAHSNMLLFMACRAEGAAEDLLAAHKAWDRAHGEPLKTVRAPHANSRDPDRRLRIGYVSCDFQEHPVGWLLADVLPTHDRNEVEVFCYANNVVEDQLTWRLKSAVDHWRDTTGVSDEAMAGLVRQDRIDILVDLAGHTGMHRLLVFARKPAPVQASWIGYPGSTGLSAMDYLVMDAATAPAGAEAWCSESLVRLPHGRFCYAAPKFAPAVVERPPGPVVFGSFNHVAKIGADVVTLWARVLKAVPQSRLVLKWAALSQAVVCERMLAAFAAEGIDADRLELRLSSPHAEMLGEYGDIDIALDPFPYSGGMTTAEALWMGVPVVTWPQRRIASRQTFAFLTELGLSDLAASSADDYVRIASALAADPARRGELRRTLRGRMQASPLTDAKAFTPGLEKAYRQMWRRWCEDLPPQAIDVA